MRAGHRITSVDRAYLADTGRTERITGLYLDFPGEPPDLALLRARVRSRAAHLPALHLRAPRRGNQWQSLRCDTDAHVFAAPATDDIDRATEHLMQYPCLPPEAPMWDLWLLPAAHRRFFRLCFRAHHGLLDGVGIAHNALALVADQPVRGPNPHRPGSPGLAGLLHLVAKKSRLPMGNWRDLSAPSHRTGKRWCHADVPEADLRALADRWGSTVNDVFLAAVAGTFRAWAQAQAKATLRAPTPPGDLLTTMPMSVRREGEENLPGNRTVFSHLRLPTSTDDPAQAMRAVLRQTRWMSHSNYRDNAQVLYSTPPTSRLVGRRLRQTWEDTPLIVSHVRLPSPFHCFGSPVTAAARLPVLGPGVHCYVGLTRVASTARLAIVHNGGLPGAQDLPALWTRCLADLRAAEPDAVT
ncbi:wax ester/triacylglycerol synthase domain-containing protein [Streptomyces sp. NPDC094032]|uniref:wax ester/triacylglycerol synthase domain-containing protein n=1 Tax=Streptomyces sp. NPDC094032 TaxID=3155308 RepID=UPI00331B9950